MLLWKHKIIPVIKVQTTLIKCWVNQIKIARAKQTKQNKYKK
jgi:hypothetical protein